MLSKCANPSCPASFRYFHQGKLFRMETASDGGGDKLAPAGKIARRAEFFWLCDQCASEMTLEHDANGGVHVKPVDRGFRVAS
jgi:hypothetical protein